MKKINRKKENCKCKYESRLTNIFTTTNNGKVIQHFVNSELRCEFKKEDMTREEFISKMLERGFEVRNYTSMFILSNGMETMEIYSDNHIGYSSPRGNSQYKTFDDFMIGNSYGSEEYSLRD